MKKLRVIFLISCCILLAAPVFSQNLDNSGNANLNGNYLFRYVVYGAASQTGQFNEGCSVTGVMTFDGNGKYAISNSQVYDTAGSSGTCGKTVNGTYGLQPNGIFQLDNILFSTTIFGAFSKPVITGSSTEDGYYDLFVAVQAPAGPVTNAVLTGPYQIGSLDFTNAQNSLARQGWFTLNADGNGNAPAFTVSGSAVNLGTSSITQQVAGATYSFSGTGIGSLTIAGAAGQSQLVSGTKVLYISADGNFVVGGSTSGTDMVFGFKAATAATNSTYSGTYFTAGLEGDLSQVSSNYSFLDSFFGGINANGAGTGIWHQRFNDVVDSSTFDYSFAETVNLVAGGTSVGTNYTTLVGAGGLGQMVIGSGTTFALDIGVQAPAYTPSTGISLNPVGVTNAANYTPVTNSYSPGELVNLYGNFGVAAQFSQIPVPTTLGGVQVLVNNIPAPVYSVGPTSISVLIPYGVGTAYFATFQVSVNGVKSNTSTVYLNTSAPGVYTLSQNAVGPSAILHPDFTAVTATNPAQAGETVLLFLNGLGAVTPAVADGVAGPSSPLSLVNTQIGVSLNDGVDASANTTISFSGLAPGFPGLYQINFVVPKTGLKNGTAYLNVQTSEAVTEMSTLSLGGFASSSVISNQSTRGPKPAVRNQMNQQNRSMGLRGLRHRAENR